MKKSYRGKATAYFAMGHEKRLGIAACLNGKKQVGDIAKQLKLSQPAASQHLNIMLSSGIVESERDGKFVYYWLTDLGKNLLRCTN